MRDILGQLIVEGFVLTNFTLSHTDRYLAPFIGFPVLIYTVLYKGGLKHLNTRAGSLPPGAFLYYLFQCTLTTVYVHPTTTGELFCTVNIHPRYILCNNVLVDHSYLWFQYDFDIF